jgi:hypothetical protein
MATTKTGKLIRLTPKQQVVLLKGLLVECQTKHFHYPDSDAMEYCAGCGRSPYNVPQHDPGCIVPRISAALRSVEDAPLPKPAATPKKRAKKHPCEDCGSKKAKHVPCPYASDLHGDKRLHWLCDMCANSRAAAL